LSFYTIERKNLAPKTFDNVCDWCIDTPAPETQFCEDEILSNGVLIKGWILSADLCDIRLLVLSKTECLTIALEYSRPDVYEKLSSKAKYLDKKDNIAFKSTLNLKDDYFQVGILRHGSYVPLADFFVRGSLEVLRGKEKWLFLDNDSNRSIEQFIGKSLIPKKELKNWKNYFAFLSHLNKSLETHFSMLIAPSKEMVYPEYYPFEKGKVTPIKQLYKIIPDDFDVCVPVAELKSSKHRSFRVCDTHWTHLGALKATLLCLSSQGKDTDLVKLIFKKDKYKVRPMGGDLGNKLYPKQRHNEKQLTSFNYLSKVVFDNGVPNFGRLIVMSNKDALYDEVLLLLGSSSSYSMFNYLTRVYRIVVFLHCAGSLDIEFIKRLRPDFVLTQTNARFIVKAPITNENYRALITRKVSSKGKDINKDISKNLQHTVEDKVLNRVILQAIEINRSI